MIDVVESEVLLLLGTVLGVELTPTSTRESVAAWDSLKHVELVFLLEDEFGMEFVHDDFDELNSVMAIVELVKRRKSDS
jgi:acyl carrier protein